MTTNNNYTSWGDDEGFPWDDDETQQEEPEDDEITREDELLKQFGINLKQHWG